MKYITCDGYVWSMRDGQYTRMVAAITEGKDINPDDFGKCLGRVTPLYNLQDELRQGADQS